MVYGVMAFSYSGRSRWLAAFLCGAIGSLAGFCSISRRSTGFEAVSLSPCRCRGGSDDVGNYLNWAAAHYGGSDPSGAGVSCRTSTTAYGFGGILGVMEGPRPLGCYPFERYNPEQLGREEGEVQQRTGTRRRHGVCAGRVPQQGGVLHTVRECDGWDARGLGGPYFGAAGSNDEEGEDEATTLCRLLGLAAICQEAPQGPEVPFLCDAAGWDVRFEVGAGTGVLSALDAELQSLADRTGDDGSGGTGKPDAVGEQDRDAEQPLPELLAPDRRGRRQRTRGANGQDFVQDKDGHRLRRDPTKGLGSRPTLGSGVETSPQRSRLLARTSSFTGNGMDGKGLKRNSHGTGRGDHSRKRQGKKGYLNVAGERRNRRREEEPQQGEKGGKEEEDGSRKRRVEELERWKGQSWKRWRRKAWWSWPRWRWQSKRRRMLRLEQWEWTMRRTPTGFTMQRKGAEAAQMHGLQIARTSIEGLSAEERFWELIAFGALVVNWQAKTHAGEGGEDSTKQPQVSRPEKGTKRKRFTGEDPPDKDNVPKDVIHVDGDYLDFEGYCGVREFVFLHHFSGKEDNLGEAVKEESARLGLKVTACSADIEKGHDLGADKPYKNHYFGAYMADVDGYHSGFPCNTYTKLRWRPLAGHPGPLRSKAEPYGFKTLSAEKKAECDRGTIYMARSVDMVKAMEEGHKDMVVKGFATLENPPPSDHPEHISAWHMPELHRLVNRIVNWESAHFTTCAYESELEIGSRHFKPQLVGGTLPGLQGLSRPCPCGKVPHEPIVGKEKSAKSAAYPKEFCKAYGKLAALHFQRMAKAEFLEGRRVIVAGSIAKRKKVIQKLEEEKEAHEMFTAEIETRFPRELAQGSDRLRYLREGTPEDEVKEAKNDEKEQEEKEAPKEPEGGNSAPSGLKREEEGDKKEAAADTAKAQEALHWKGGDGHYGMIRQRKEEKVSFQPVGGMRDPHLAVKRLPTVQALGKRTWSSWEEFVKKRKDALLVAEAYGTEKCQFDEGLVQEWKKVLVGLWEPPRKQGLDLKANNIYYTPVDTEMIRGWQKKAGDPEKWVPYWLEVGAPLGIERSIQTAGVFPILEAEEERHQGE